MVEPQVAFRDVPANMFPIHIEMFRVDTREVVWEVTMDGPGALRIPPLGMTLGVGIGSRVTDAHGHSDEVLP